MATVTFRNGDLYALGNAVPPNPNLLSQLVSLEGIPARVHIRLVRLVKLLGATCADLKETQNKYIHLYGEDKGNGTWSITGPNDQGNPLSPNWNKYREEMEDLMAQTTEITFEKVILPGHLVIDGALLLAFEPFLDVADEGTSTENGKANEPIPLPQRVK